MRFLPKTNGFHGFEGLRKAGNSHVATLSQPGTVLSRTASQWRNVYSRSEHLAMFSLSAKSCRTFTFAEVLIMAAMNVETTRLSSEKLGRSKSAAAQKR